MQPDASPSHAVLGIPSDASLADIKQAYEDLLIVWDPDRYPDRPSLQAKARIERERVQAAFRELCEARPVRDPRAEALPILTSLRFFAALAVVLFHATFIVQMPAWLNQAANQGRAGVSFFFILSGFILTYNYYDRFAGGVTRSGWRTFARARFARVFPMHAAALVLLTPGIVYLLAKGMLGMLEWPHSVPLLTVSWLANLAALQVWIPVKWFQELWNVPSWSIGCELFFYALFPWLVATLYPRHRRGGAVVALMVGAWLLQGLIFGVAVSSIREQYPLWEHHRWLLMFGPERHPLLRLGEFVVGAGLGTLFLRARALPAGLGARRWLDHGGLRNGLLTGALIAIALLVRAMPDGWLGPVLEFGRYYPLFVPLFAAVIFLAAWGPTWLTPVLGRRPVILLGEASYSLYLLHWIPVILILYLRVVLTIDPPYILSQQGALMAMLATLPLAILCYHLIEVPARRALRGKTGQSRASGV